MAIISKAAVAGIALLLAAAPPASAQEQAAPNGGAAGPPGVAPATTISGSIVASYVYTKASVGTGGAGLRNRSGSSLSVSDVTMPTKAAYAYWAVISNGTPPSSTATITVTRRVPLPEASALVTGTVVGTGASPCWGGTRTTVYRGVVPIAVATRNGTYEVRLGSGASGLTTGEDPWNGHTVFPLFEGVSLVIVGSGTRTVGLFDRGLSGKTFGTVAGDGLTYSLRLPVAATSAGVDWYNIGADGQSGLSLSDTQAFTNEVTKINGVTIAGTGGLNLDSDWNGGAARPLPQLWDNTAHNITKAAKTGTTSLSISFTTKTDCLVPVANVTVE